MDIERCIVCDEPTGRAGKGEDSLFCELCDEGPFCEDHVSDTGDEVICFGCYAQRYCAV